MKKQFISCLFCLMTVCLLFTGFTHSLFHSFQNFHFSTKKTEKTIHLKIEKYQIAVIEMEEEDDELLMQNHFSVPPTNPSIVFALQQATFQNTTCSKQHFYKNFHNEISTPLWLETLQIII